MGIIFVFVILLTSDLSVYKITAHNNDSCSRWLWTLEAEKATPFE